jgi:tetratricopeptide (TPR) repeat protein
MTTSRVDQLLAFLVQSPDDPFLVHALALEHIKVGDDAQARVLFEQNLSNHPTYVATFYHLGKLLERNGLSTEALQVYERGMEAAKAAADNHSFSELRGAFEELSY